MTQTLPSVSPIAGQSTTPLYHYSGVERRADGLNEIPYWVVAGKQRHRNVGRHTLLYHPFETYPYVHTRTYTAEVNISRQEENIYFITGTLFYYHLIRRQLFYLLPAWYLVLGSAPFSYSRAPHLRPPS